MSGVARGRSQYSARNAVEREIGIRLNSTRVRHGIRLKDIEGGTGINYRSINRIESSGHGTGLVQYARYLARSTGVTMDYLLCADLEVVPKEISEYA